MNNNNCKGEILVIVVAFLPESDSQTRFNRRLTPRKSNTRRGLEKIFSLERPKQPKILVISDQN